MSSSQFRERALFVTDILNIKYSRQKISSIEMKFNKIAAKINNFK